MKNNKFLLMGGLALFAGFTQMAAAMDQSSGCGMGWQVAPNNSIVSSSTRSMVNATFSNTFGMTSGTSGCSKHSIVQLEKKATHFAEANKGQLMIEMAKGEGEHLRSLAAVLGCSAAGASRLGSELQQGYSRVFPSSATSAAEMLDSVRSVIQSDFALAIQCGHTG